jgi:hypothetical protein
MAAIDQDCLAACLDDDTVTVFRLTHIQKMA